MFSFSKHKKGDPYLTLTARILDLEGSHRIISSEEVFKSYTDIKRREKK